MKKHRCQTFGSEPHEWQDVPQMADEPCEQTANDCAAEFAEAKWRLEDELNEVKWKLQDETLSHTQAEEAIEVLAERVKNVTVQLAQAERERLACILHDDLQQLLVAAKFKIGILASPMKKQERDNVVGEAADILDEAFDQTRSLVAELAPPGFLRQGDRPGSGMVGTVDAAEARAYDPGDGNA